MMSKLDDYTTFLLSLPSTPAFPKTTTHTLFLRPHAPKIPTEIDSRSIFVVNVPIDSTPEHFRAVIISLVGAGRFESIAFEHDKQKASAAPSLEISSNKGKKRKRQEAAHELDTDLPQIWDRPLRKSGSTAVITLVDEKSVEVVFKAIRKLHKSKSPSWPVWGQGIEDKIPALGSARYLAHQTLRYPDPQTLQANVDAFMTAWNLQEEAKANFAKRQRNVPDEDGFVTVTRGGRTGPARREEAESKKAEMEEKERKRKEEMGDFYRFQMRERRKEEQGELIKRFEEDRKKVEAMKEKRGKFRPER